MSNITLNLKTTRFFIAISKIGKHSFLMLGTYDRNNMGQLLCRVGKAGIPDRESNPCSVMCNVFFSKVGSKLADEGITRSQQASKEINYQAYDITYDQYLKFVQILEEMQTDKNKFQCYKPISQDGDNVVLKYTSTRTLPHRENPTDLKINELNINNTCRHTAIKLVEETQGSPVSSLVSERFYIDLPYQTNLVYGKPSSEIPFYVLPVSPAAFPDLTIEKKSLLNKLYLQMEHMLLIEPNSIPTQNKFNCLKDLYLDILGPQKDLSLDDLLSSILLWKKTNEPTLSVLRKTFFWDSFITRQSATMQLIDDIEHDLKLTT